ERVQRVDPKNLDKNDVAGADLIVLEHPGKLSQESINLLAALLRRGRAILYIAAEPVDASNLKILAGAAGSDMQMPVEFVPPPANQVRRNLFLAEVANDQAPFAEFGESLPAAIGPLRFSGGLASR